MGEETGSGYKILVEEPEGKIYFGRLGRRQEDNIKVDFVEIVSKILDWLHQAKSKEQFQVLANVVMDRSVSPAATVACNYWLTYSAKR
jgi:hypothetical protein